MAQGADTGVGRCGAALVVEGPAEGTVSPLKASRGRRYGPIRPSTRARSMAWMRPGRARSLQCAAPDDWMPRP